MLASGRQYYCDGGAQALACLSVELATPYSVTKPKKASHLGGIPDFMLNFASRYQSKH